jgi:hypothetical protein
MAANLAKQLQTGITTIFCYPDIFSPSSIGGSTNDFTVTFTVMFAVTFTVMLRQRKTVEAAAQIAKPIAEAFKGQPTLLNFQHHYPMANPYAILRNGGARCPGMIL